MTVRDANNSSTEGNRLEDEWEELEDHQEHDEQTFATTDKLPQWRGCVHPLSWQRECIRPWQTRPYPCDAVLSNKPWHVLVEDFEDTLVILRFSVHIWGCPSTPTPWHISSGRSVVPSSLTLKTKMVFSLSGIQREMGIHLVSITCVGIISIFKCCNLCKGQYIWTRNCDSFFCEILRKSRPTDHTVYEWWTRTFWTFRV